MHLLHEKAGMRVAAVTFCTAMNAVKRLEWFHNVRLIGRFIDHQWSLSAKVICIDDCWKN